MHKRNILKNLKPKELKLRDRNILKESKIILTNSKGVFSDSLAEHVLLTILYFIKKTPYFLETRKKHRWAPIEVGSTEDLSAAIVGCDNIGYNIAKLLKCTIRPAILACCNILEDIKPEHRMLCNCLVTANEYEQVIRFTDFVICALLKTTLMHYKEVFRTWETYGKFNMMEKSAIFINIGEGGKVIEDDLVKALKEEVV